MLIEKLLIFTGLLVTALMSSVVFSFVVLFKLCKTLTLVVWNRASAVTMMTGPILIKRP